MDHTTTPVSRASWRTVPVVLLAGCLIAMVGFGIRAVFGLFLEPMTQTHGWGRETFAMAMAIQNLLWGLGLPVAGALADRFGAVRVIAAGALVYAAGVWGMAQAASPLALHLFGGVMTGLGVAFTAFSLALAAMARVVSPARRSFALGLGTAAGSLGQVVFSPLSQALIAAHGWHASLIILASTALALVPLAFVLPGNRPGELGRPEQSLREALREAAAHRGYVLLTAGFFVCGFHVAFITVHFPAYVRDLGLPAEVGAYALALVGLFNIAGSFLAGVAGQRFSMRTSLAAIYLARAAIITALLLAPPGALSVYLFSAAMGMLWLSTVPLTTGIVAQVFGVRYMATLFGVVFLSHQVGSFLGVWLGGWIHDATGSYDAMWWAGVFFGLVAALVHLPIDERPLPRLASGATV